METINEYACLLYYHLLRFWPSRKEVIDILALKFHTTQKPKDQNESCFLKKLCIGLTLDWGNLAFISFQTTNGIVSHTSFNLPLELPTSQLPSSSTAYLSIRLERSIESKNLFQMPFAKGQQKKWSTFSTSAWHGTQDRYASSWMTIVMFLVESNFGYGHWIGQA